eukprot:7514792-Alexandrium_andersonii.AAC.1
MGTSAPAMLSVAVQPGASFHLRQPGSGPGIVVGRRLSVPAGPPQLQDAERGYHRAIVRGDD